MYYIIALFIFSTFLVLQFCLIQFHIFRDNLPLELRKWSMSTLPTLNEKTMPSVLESSSRITIGEDCKPWPKPSTTTTTQLRTQTQMTVVSHMHTQATILTLPARHQITCATWRLSIRSLLRSAAQRRRVLTLITSQARLVQPRISKTSTMYSKSLDNNTAQQWADLIRLQTIQTR